MADTKVGRSRTEGILMSRQDPLLYQTSENPSGNHIDYDGVGSKSLPQVERNIINIRGIA